MRLSFFAPFALAVASASSAQNAISPAAADPHYAPVPPGTWFYSPAPGGSEAMFLDTAAHPQLIVRCTRATRRVTISKPASVAAPYLRVWTNSLDRNLAVTFNPATARITAELVAFDPLLDAIAFSRGRIAAGIPGSPLLIAPAWPEAARTIEDCRI